MSLCNYRFRKSARLSCDAIRPATTAIGYYQLRVITRTRLIRAPHAEVEEGPHRGGAADVVTWFACAELRDARLADVREPAAVQHEVVVGGCIEGRIRDSRGERRAANIVEVTCRQRGVRGGRGAVDVDARRVRAAEVSLRPPVETQGCVGNDVLRANRRRVEQEETATQLLKAIRHARVPIRHHDIGIDLVGDGADTSPGLDGRPGLRYAIAVDAPVTRRDAGIWVGVGSEGVKS